MGSSSLRRTQLPAEEHSQELLESLSTDQLNITNINERTASSLCGDYSFDGQTVYSGDLHFQEKGVFGGGRDLTLGIEFRAGSEMLLLESEVDLPSLDTILDHLNRATPNEICIYHNLTVNREALWDFLINADQIIELSVLSSEGKEQQLNEFEGEKKQEIIGKSPIEAATVAFNANSHRILVHYNAGRLTVNSDWEDATEYAVQRFERDVIDEYRPHED